MPVRSKQLGIGSFGDAATHVIYTVPAGFRTIVKYLTVRNAGAAGVVTITVTPAVGGAAIFGLDVAASGATGATVRADTWLVLNAGDKLSVTFPTASGGWYTASGAELGL